MSGPPPADRPGPASDGSTAQARIGILTDHFARNRERYTPEALRAAALDAGYTAEEADQALGLAASRREDELVVRPLRSRARLIAIAAYLLGFAMVAYAFLSDQINQYSFEEGGLAVFAVVLGLALLVSIRWVNGRGQTLAAMLIVPLALLFAVSGLCLYSGGLLPLPGA